MHKTMVTRVRFLVAIFLNVRVSSKHLKHATSDHQNNARGLLVNISSFLLNVISPTNPFLNISLCNNLYLRLLSVVSLQRLNALKLVTTNSLEIHCKETVKAKESKQSKWVYNRPFGRYILQTKII
jgi:hypothetical protein